MYALRPRHECLEAGVEPEEASRAGAVAQNGVEGTEQTRARGRLGQLRKPTLPVVDGVCRARLRAVERFNRHGRYASRARGLFAPPSRARDVNRVPELRKLLR